MYTQQINIEQISFYLNYDYHPKGTYRHADTNNPHAEDHAQTKKVTKTIQNPNAKSPYDIRSRHSYPRQDDDEDERQSHAYSRHKSASPEPMDQFVEVEQFNTLTNDVSNLNEAVNETQDRIDSMDAKLDKLVAMFQKNNQTIAPDINSVNGTTPPPLPRTGNTRGTTPNNLIANLFPWLDQTILTSVISRKSHINPRRIWHTARLTRRRQHTRRHSHPPTSTHPCSMVQKQRIPVQKHTRLLHSTFSKIPDLRQPLRLIRHRSSAICNSRLFP